MPDGIPALVVSGFLGSGKTTLVRSLLADAQRRRTRMAVISNEFGDLGIDQALLGDGSDAYVELEGGCVCCQLSDDLVKTLQSLWEDVRPDGIILETSGVALPFDTQLHFWRPPVSDWVTDDMAVVVVNAEQVAERRDLDGTFEDQVTSADLLLLNKVDLVPAGTLPAVEATLREFEPETPIIRMAHGNVDPAILFPPDPAGARAARRRNPPVAPPHHHETFAHEELSLPAGLAIEAVRARLRGLNALRAKGFVETGEGLQLVQVVGRRVELAPYAGTPPPELVGRIVVIRRASSLDLL